MRKLASRVAKIYRGIGGWQGVFGAFIILLAIPLFAASATSDDALSDVAAGAVWFVGIYGVVLIALFAGDAFRIGKNPEGEHIGTIGFLLFLGLSATAYLLTAGALAVATLSNSFGWDVSDVPAQDQVNLGDLHQEMLYEGLRTIPLIDVPSTLGWQDPISDPAPLLGWVSLFVKLILVLVLISGIYRLINVFRNLRIKEWRLAAQSPARLQRQRQRRNQRTKRKAMALGGGRPPRAEGVKRSDPG
jgi:hypothetical protein